MGELDFSAGGLAEHGSTLWAHDGGLGVGEELAHVAAIGAPHVQEVGVGGLNESLKFVHTLLSLRVGVQKVHFHCAKSVFRAKIYI